MLILILINVHYLQNFVSSFQEDSNGQNHSFSDPHHPRFPTLLLGGFSPLKNTGDGSIYIYTSKTSEGGNIFLRKYIISKSVMEDSTTSKRKANSQCPPTLSAGRGERGAEKFVMLAIMKARPFTEQ